MMRYLLVVLAFLTSHLKRINLFLISNEFIVLTTEISGFFIYTEDSYPSSRNAVRDLLNTGNEAHLVLSAFRY